jgi:TonB family protein
VAPLSEEDEEQERFPVARIAVGAVLLVTLLAVRFLAMRPDVWHALLAGAGPSLHSAYSNVAERLSVLKREATTPTRQATSDTTGGGTTAADANSTAAAAPASGPSASDTATDLTAEPVTSEAADAQLTVTPQEPVKKQTEANRNTTRAERVESAAADESVVRVPASMMAAHLISSRVPAYPEGAKAQEIEGPVVMEVVVATNGAVKQVHVIDGDRRLRAAAEEAVMKWRYRPYLLNGSPVEIATTVRVDFRLPQ